MRFTLNACHEDAGVRAQALTMSLSGEVQGVKATVLFDSGAVPNVISSAFVEQHKLAVQPSPFKAVTVADGSSVPVKGTVCVDVLVQGVKFRVLCHVLELSLEWTVILGESWLRQARASLDYAAPAIRGYTRKNKPFVLQCTKDTAPLNGSTCVDPSVLVISARQAARCLRRGCRPFICNVNELLSDSDGPSAQPPSLVSDILSEFADVFPPDVPHLPPERPGVTHTIPLVDSQAKPPSRPLYRLSPAERAEADRQVKLLLDKGYIVPSSSPYGAPILFVQ